MSGVRGKKGRGRGGWIGPTATVTAATAGPVVAAAAVFAAASIAGSVVFSAIFPPSSAIAAAAIAAAATGDATAADAAAMMCKVSAIRIYTSQYVYVSMCSLSSRVSAWVWNLCPNHHI